MKYEERSRDQAHSGSAMIPTQVAAEIKRREHTEDRQGNHFLDHFELDGREAGRSDSISRNL